MPSPRKIVLTGVSRGLGRAMIEGFVEAGHTVFGCARDEGAIRELAERYPSPHFFEPVDVSSLEQVRRFAETVLPEAGPPDLLINNAATMNEPAPLWEIAPETFQAMMDVNIVGTFNMIHAFVPAMVATERGIIVNFSSGWGRSPGVQVAPYTATKWAVEGLTRALAKELPDTMAAVPLNPGIINTDMLRTCWKEGAGNFPDAQAWARRAVPYILSITPDESGHPLTVPG